MWLQRLLTFLRFYFKCSRCCLPINSKRAGHSDVWHWRSIFIQKTATHWIFYFFMPLSVYPRDGCVCVCAINNIKIYNSKIQRWCCKSKKSCRNIMIWSSLCYRCCCFKSNMTATHWRSETLNGVHLKQVTHCFQCP